MYRASTRAVAAISSSPESLRSRRVCYRLGSSSRSRSRTIVRSIHENARDMARRIAKTPEYKRSRRQRKKVEILFAHLKRILKLDRLRLRGLSGASDEFLLAASAQNLRRMAIWLETGPPETLVASPI